MAGKAEETKVEETKVEEVTKVKVKIIKNIKYGNDPYEAGEKIEINEQDLEEFKAAGVIDLEEQTE